MNGGQPEASHEQVSRSDDFRVDAPRSTLPTGGGAVRGIGEKFSAIPVTGTGSLTVPIGMSPGRSGFGPVHSLSYDSGSGNSAFGFGWYLALPSITRKTELGLPQYLDCEDSDVFILSGAEDLVPDGSIAADTKSAPGYAIRRYHPRVEGSFARIERWTRLADGDIYWLTISRDNILTLYGSDENSRIADPNDPSHVFSWLICESRDDRGNAIIYHYKPEDGAELDLTLIHERNRGDRDDKCREPNRYLKRIQYGNRAPVGVENRSLQRLSKPQIDSANWMFEVVFDYGDHHKDWPDPRDDEARDDDSKELKFPWPSRPDCFSTYRPGFEVRTCRICRRVLMFHNFPEEESIGAGCLVRSTDLRFSCDQDPPDPCNPIYAFLVGVTETGYSRKEGGGYDSTSVPPVEFRYTQPLVHDAVEELDLASLENLPIGLDGVAYEWIDLHGEGTPGILTEQGGTWFYKRNLSPLPLKQTVGPELITARFAPTEVVGLKPNLTLAGTQFIDLSGKGLPDLVAFDGPMAGLYEHDGEEGWQSFRPFSSRLNWDTQDSNLKFIDLDGDGHADVLITDDDALTWHPSLAEAGFGPARRVAPALNEEVGPRLMFADGTDSIFLADFSGDGLTDLVRIRQGEIAYWPNLGHGRFGAKVSMDHAPVFDNPDQFDLKRIRLADIDGSGTTDIIYLHRDGVSLYFNQSGNSWGNAQLLNAFPRVDDLVSIVPADLLGNGTACLVWSSPLSGDGQRHLRYVNLMGGQKPHLLTRTINNLGAETKVTYAPSTKFYLKDKYEGNSWDTRLPFPVHVVERVETYDHIGRNRFVTRYAYHDGFFDPEEREFRGFGMVEQWDTEEFASLTADGPSPGAAAVNFDAASNLPAVCTKTWFHTGSRAGRSHAMDGHDRYFREVGLTDEEARALLLPNSDLPVGLTLEEEREALRALKGSMLRQEIYALDGSAKERFPYTVTEQNFTVRLEQARGKNRHAVFFSHPREQITYHYERNPADPRIQHALTLEVNEYGNVLKEVSIGYGRRTAAMDPDLTDEDKAKQTETLATYTETRFTNPIDDGILHPHDYRAPIAADARTFHLTGFKPEDNAARFKFDEWSRNGFALLATSEEIPYEKTADNIAHQARMIEQVRTLYRKDNLNGLLPLFVLEPHALSGESYKLALTLNLLTNAFMRDGRALLPNLAEVLGGQAADQGGYVPSQRLKASALFPDADLDDHWWMPSGRAYLSPRWDDSPGEELAFARSHFFLPRRTRNPFHTEAIRTESLVTYDDYDLLLAETRDALGNTITALNDYRVLKPRLVSDPNGNRTAVAYDRLGLVAGTFVMGKDFPGIPNGDSPVGFVADLTNAQTDEFFDGDLQARGLALLKDATTRIVYDLDKFRRTQQAHPGDPDMWLPPYAAAIAREIHSSDETQASVPALQIAFTYSDGFGREVQKNIPAEPGPLVDRGPTVPRRVVSGWTIFNNKNGGKPVRQYEPYFSATHRFEFGVKVGVSPILFYDPVERLVATLHPNQTYEKVVFDPWLQKTYDVNDTIAIDPSGDEDVKGFFLNLDGTSRLPQTEYLPTWHSLRTDPAHTAVMNERWPDSKLRDAETIAATNAEIHTGTPTTAHLDTLGRPFLTLMQNRYQRNGAVVDEKYATRVELDIQGNQREVRDARDRIVMRYDYDMLGVRIHQSSMEAGERWKLTDVSGMLIRAWDSRGHTSRMEYDPLRRPVRSFVTGADGANADHEHLTDRLVYGEQHPESELLNLRGKLYVHLDQVGASANEERDFKGNLLRSSRRLAKVYDQPIDWNDVDATIPRDSATKLVPSTVETILSLFLEAENFTGRTEYDALNRPIQMVAPHSDRVGSGIGISVNVIQPTYNEAALLKRVDVWLGRSEEPANRELLRREHESPDPVGVNNIDYDAKGRRLRIQYKNGAATRYKYDRETSRLIHLHTRRGATFAEDSDNPQPPPPRIAAPEVTPTGKTCGLQNLHYTYDPVGNITSIRDDAQPTIYFNGEVVPPHSKYLYDAIYRLIRAEGREHIGQASQPETTWNDEFRARLPHPGDGNAMRNYGEKYEYDAVGNFESLVHDATNGNWTRSYSYSETSLIEDGIGLAPRKTSNRLSGSSIVRNSRPPNEAYVYDIHGNMVRMPHLGGIYPAPNMHWDYRDQLRQTDHDGGGTAFYVYDASGQRVRKVWEKTRGLTEERIYLGGFEIYRRHNGAIGPNTANLERETLHVMGDQQRIAMVERKTHETGILNRIKRFFTGTEKLIRYQLGNHVGSASLELDDRAMIISYEEYYPYGTTAYQAVRKQTETPKRYRYAGKERDEESGLYYHGARYLAPWLGRWTSCDPAGVADDLNLFPYVANNPIRFCDPNGRAKFEARKGFLFEQNVAHYNTESAREAMQAARGTPGFADAKVRFTAVLTAELEVDESVETQAKIAGVMMNVPLIPLLATPPGMVYGAAQTGVAVGEAATGARVTSLNPTSPDFGRTTPMSGLDRVENLGWAASELLPGLGTELVTLRREAKAARAVASNVTAVADGERGFINVPGMTFDANLTDAEREAWTLSLQYDIEYATVNGGSLLTDMKPGTVSIPFDPPIVTASHTHPRSGRPLPSTEDVEFAADAEHSLDAVHRIIGFKFPNTNELLAQWGQDTISTPIAGQFTTSMARNVPPGADPIKLPDVKQFKEP